MAQRLDEWCHACGFRATDWSHYVRFALVKSFFDLAHLAMIRRTVASSFQCWAPVEDVTHSVKEVFAARLFYSSALMHLETHPWIRAEALKQNGGKSAQIWVGQTTSPLTVVTWSCSSCGSWESETENLGDRKNRKRDFGDFQIWAQGFGPKKNASSKRLFGCATLVGRPWKLNFPESWEDPWGKWWVFSTWWNVMLRGRCS